MGFVIFMLIVIGLNAYIETHWDRILEEIAISRMVRESYKDARKVFRNPVRVGSAGYHPERSKWWEQ